VIREFCDREFCDSGVLASSHKTHILCFLGGLVGSNIVPGLGGRIPFGPIPCVGPCLPDCTSECIQSYLLSLRGGINGGCISGIGGGMLELPDFGFSTKIYFRQANFG
jgi:hypothetical protein